MGPVRSSLRVLVVEDDDDHREALIIALGALGIEGRGLADGEQAVAHVLEAHPDVVLMDLAMPRVDDGIEATRRIRAADIPQPHIIIVSGHIAPDVCKEAFAAGCDEFFLKGDLAQLRDALRALERRPPRRGESGTLACNAPVTDAATRERS